MSKAESLEWAKRPKKGAHPEYAAKKHDAEASHGSYRIDKYYDSNTHFLTYQPKGSGGGGRMVGGNAQYPSLGAAQKAAAEHHESKTKPESKPTSKGAKLKAFASKAHSPIQTSAKGAKFYINYAGSKVYVK